MGGIFTKIWAKTCVRWFWNRFYGIRRSILALWRLSWVDRMYIFQDTGKNFHSLALKPILRHSLFYFLYFGGYFDSIEGIVANILAKTFIRRLWNRFYGIRCCIFCILEVILILLKVSLPIYWRKRSFACFESGYTSHAVFFALWRLFAFIGCSVAKIHVKTFIRGFEINFKVFAVLFLALWRLFWVNWRYRSQDTGINIYSAVLKPVLRHSLFYFKHFGSYYESIKGTVTKIRAKFFIHRLWNRFYGIRCSIFSSLEFILSQWKVPLPRYGWKCSFALLKLVLRHSLFYF